MECEKKIKQLVLADLDETMDILLDANCKTLNNNTLKKSIKNINSYSYEDILINRLNSGNKINLGGF